MPLTLKPLSWRRKEQPVDGAPATPSWQPLWSQLWRRHRRPIGGRVAAAQTFNVSSRVPATQAQSQQHAGASAPPPLRDSSQKLPPSSPVLLATSPPTIDNHPSQATTNTFAKDTQTPIQCSREQLSKSDSTKSSAAIPPVAAVPSSRKVNQTQPPAHTCPTITVTMAERTLQTVLKQLHSDPNLPYPEASSLLSKAKISLLQLNALTPTPKTPANLLSVARDVYEAGALFSIRAKDADAFTRYVSQLQPFYELPASAVKPNNVERNKVTGLYLLLLLTQGRYGEFHSELESLTCREAGVEIENDRFLGYPIKLERWLMEGSYDRVWKAMKSREVPCEEYGVFFEILTSQIRSEIASSSERAYPSLPLSSTKSLLFLDSEGAVIEFANQRGWAVRDGQIYFPTNVDGEDGEEKDISQMVIENTLGYARELETIV